MKTRIPVQYMIALALGLAVGCSKIDNDDKPAVAPEQAGAKAETAGVTLDAETQERIGLKIETPSPAQWQPSVHATGFVADPFAFTAAISDYEIARTAAAASQAELDRTQNLAAQDNASARALEAAQAAASRDKLALAAARAKFAADWGAALAASTNLAAIAEKLQTGGTSYVKLFLPAANIPNPPPDRATIFILGNETNAIPASFSDALQVDPATQEASMLFETAQKLPPNISVEARLETSGNPVSGVVIPADAVLRYEGKGWVYVQTATNQFVRAEIPLDRFTAGGWFVSESLTESNRIVVTGAQTVLSTELSSSEFTTGERD